MMKIRIATKEDMPAVFALRFEVFVGEQHVPAEIEQDEEDVHAMHVLAEQGGAVVGCARVILSRDEAHIGRLAVKKELRGQGIGSSICRFLIEYCEAQAYSHIWLHSQLHAKGFYETLGFRPQGETFFEAGIEHIKMTRDMPTAHADQI